MSKFVLMYDRGASDVNALGKNVKHQQGSWIDVRDINSMEDVAWHLGTLRHQSVNRLLFYTHGAAGLLNVGEEKISGSDFRNLAGKGFSDVFTPGAEIFFDGCQIAKGTDGKLFLDDVAKALLLKGGGRAGGWDKDGYFWPSFGGTEVHHVGSPSFAIIKPGGTRTRLAIGKELIQPYGRWQVTVHGRMRYEYGFDLYGNVYYRALDLPIGETGVGTWELKWDGLKIQWIGGKWEIWDLPLFDEHQTGRRGGVEVTAVKMNNQLQREADRLRTPLVHLGVD